MIIYEHGVQIERKLAGMGLGGGGGGLTTMIIG